MVRRTSSYEIHSEKEDKQKKKDEKTLYLSYLPKDFDSSKVFELFSSCGVDKSVINRVDIPYKTANEIKGIAFVELLSQKEMEKALDCWKQKGQDYAKLGVKIKPYIGNNKINESSHTKDAPPTSATSPVNSPPSKAASIYESAPTFNYTSGKSKRRPSLTEKDKQLWEPDPSTSSMRPKLNILPKTTDPSSPSKTANIVIFHPIRQPRGPDSANSRGFTKPRARIVV